MAKKLELFVDIVGTDLGNARVRLFTEFHEAGDARISCLVTYPQQPGKMTISVHGQMSEEQKKLTARRLG